MNVEQQPKLDLLSTNNVPALSSTSDMPVVETKPDAQNEGSPPQKPVAEPKAALSEVEGKTTSEPATEHTEESPGEPAQDKKPARGVQKRLDELTKRAADAERLAEAERQEKLRILALLERGPVREGGDKQEPAQTKEEVEPVRPKRADFQTPDEYDAAVDQYIVDKSSFIARKEYREARAADKQEAEKKTAEEASRKIQQEFSARIEKTRQEFPDYDEVTGSASDVMVSVPVTNVIMTHELGSRLGYYLAKNREEAARIFSLPIDQQLMEVGLIFSGFKTQVKPQGEPAPVVVKPSITQAPKPIKPLGAGSEASTKTPEEESMDEYAARRRTEESAKRRPGMRH